MDTSRIGKAMEFASVAHAGQHRKGTDVPYITHPVETAFIVMTLTADEDVIIAALLHDVVEDTKYSLDDIRERFGERVAELVDWESEDKMRHLPAADSWKARKKSSLQELKVAPVEAKMICLGDKISNMRASAERYAIEKEVMWQAFNQKNPKEQEWYYRSIMDCISEFKNTEAYKEYASLCDKVFPHN